MTVLHYIGPLVGRRETDPQYCQLCCVAIGLACFIIGAVAGTFWPLF